MFGLRVVVYPNDHRPAHVHVIGNGCEAVFKLNCPDGPPELRENHHFSHIDLNRIDAELSKHVETLCAAWRRMHEDF
jgi:Fe2+ or Zn2+ uptake regulation protein